MIILKSKLTPPRLNGTFERRRLNNLFKNFEKRKLMGIIAGAGYGKTTLAAQACQELKVNTVWYRLDPSDNDFTTLIRYLVTGIRQYYSSFGVMTLERIGMLEELRSGLQSVCTDFLFEAEEEIKEQLVIVLDDFHLIQRDPEVKEAIGYILTNLPDKLHLFITSRTPLEIDLSSLIVKREAAVISERELAFTDDETLTLYINFFDAPLTDTELTLLQEKVEGWAAGLVLFIFSLNQNKEVDVEQQLKRLNCGSHFFEEYIEENIFKLLPVETRAFLIRTSILSRLEVELCNHLLRIDNAEEILIRLEKRHLFTFVSDHQHQTYYYHHLFRDFLRNKLKQQMDPYQLNQLYHRVAQLWEEREEYSEAINCYLSAQTYEAAADLLVQEGFRMADNGQINQVIFFCRQIPVEKVEENLWLMNLLGAVQLRGGRRKEAWDTFKKIRERFIKHEDREGVGFCLTCLADLYCTFGDFAKAEEIFKYMLTHMPQSSKSYRFSLNSLIFISSRLGKLEVADNYRRVAEQNSASQDESAMTAYSFASYAFRFLLSGDFSQVIYYGGKVWNIASRHRIKQLMVTGCQLMASGFFFQGDYQICYEKAKEGIRISEKYSILNLSYTWCHLIAAWALIAKENYSEALEHCNLSLSISTENHFFWFKAYAYVSMSHIYIKNNDLDLAETCARKALEAIQDPTFDLDADKNYFKLTLAYVLLLKNRLNDANELVNTLKKHPFESKIMRRWLALFFAGWHWYNGRFDDVREELEVVLENLQVDERDYFLFDQQEWMTPFLVEIYASRRYQKQITSLLSSFLPQQLKVIHGLSQNESPSIRAAAKYLTKVLSHGRLPDLYISCFGAFKVIRGDYEIPSEHWTSGKAKTLFKYLALYSDQGYINKDRLLEMLWPDQDPAVTTKRLHVALSTIRRILQPELTRGEPSSYLIRQKDGYKLTFGKNGFVDTMLFEHFLNEASETEDPSKRLHLYLSAEKLYSGPLFDDDPFSQWCVGPREKYRDKYIQLLTKIADRYKDEKNFTACREYLYRILEIDDYAEEIYFRLMFLYHERGNRLMAKKTYETCKNKLEVDLECPLTEKTEALYRQIMS